MKKFLIILATILILVSLKAEASYTPPNSVTPGGISGAIQYNNAGAFGGITASTTNSAQSNLNLTPLTSAGYVVAQCVGGGDQSALTTAAVAAFAAKTSILIAGANPFANPKSCQLNNSFNMPVAFADFFAWPQKYAYQSSDVFGGRVTEHIHLSNGFSPGAVNVEGFTTPSCFFNLGSAVHMSFTNLTMTADDSTSNGAVAFCTATSGAQGSQKAIVFDHSSITRIPSFLGCAIDIPTSATGTYTFTGNPTNGQTIILNGVTWTFVTSGATGNQTNIQGSATATVTQLASDLNASAVATIALSTYTANSLVLNVSYKVRTAATPSFTKFGTAGNFYTLAAGTYAGTVSGATLTGGKDWGTCARYGGNVYEAYVINSTIIEVQAAISGNDSDLFVMNNEISGSLYTISGITGADFANGSWKIIGNRTEFVGTPGYGTINMNGVHTVIVADNSFDNVRSAVVQGRTGWKYLTFTGNTVNGWGGASVMVGNQLVGADGVFEFNGSGGGSGSATITGNVFQNSLIIDSGGNPNAPNYWGRFDGSTDNNISFTGNVGSYNVAPYFFNNETPGNFISDNVGLPHIENGRNTALCNLGNPQAGFDTSGCANGAYIPLLTTPAGSTTPLNIRINNGTAPLASGQTAYYKCDDASGSTVTESVAAANGTWNGTLGSQWTTGIINGGCNFNGTDNTVTTTYGGITGTAARTINFWVNTTKSSYAGGSARFFYYGGTAGQYVAVQPWDTYGGFYPAGIGLTLETGSQAITYTTPTLYNGNWHMVTIVIPAAATLATAQLYLDANLLTTVTLSINPSTAINTGTGNFIFGGGPGAANLYRDKLDEFGVWNRALSASEVTQLYNGNVGLQYPFVVGPQTAPALTFSNLAGTVLSAFGADGQSLGIGTTAPLSPLQVVGLGTSGASIGTSAGALYMCVKTNGATYLSATCP